MRGSEFEQMLDETLRELEDELETEDELEAESEPDWTTRNLLEFQGMPDNVFSTFFARVSGFDLHSTTSPDPDVAGLHNAAADRISREIVARFTEISTFMFPKRRCVFVTVTGFVDPKSESESRDFDLGDLRAKALWTKVEARLGAFAKKLRGISCLKVGKAGSNLLLLDDKTLFPSTTGTGRHLNRRVVVKVWLDECPPGGCK